MYGVLPGSKVTMFTEEDRVALRDDKYRNAKWCHRHCSDWRFFFNTTYRLRLFSIQKKQVIKLNKHQCRCGYFAAVAITSSSIVIDGLYSPVGSKGVLDNFTWSLSARKHVWRIDFCFYFIYFSLPFGVVEVTTSNVGVHECNDNSAHVRSTTRQEK